MIGILLISMLFSVAVLPGLCQAQATPDKADAVYLDVTETYTLNEDGSMVRRHEHKLAYLTPYAFSRVLGETFIVFNPDYQELEIVRAVTTMPGGEEVPCTPNAINDILPGFCRGAPPYMHLRERVVTHLGLGPGSVAHLIYEIKSNPEFSPFLMGREVFSATQPVDRKTVVVKVPKAIELKYELLNSEDGEPDVADDGAFKTYSWTLNDLPMAPPEGMAQSEGDCAPALVFSTCPSWREAGMLIDRGITRAAWLDDKMTKIVEDLWKESNGGVEFVRAVNRFVVEEVASANVDPLYLWYKPRPAQETLGFNVGCNLDKMILLVAMLRGKGYFAEPVFISRDRAVAREVPSMAQFEECRVICTLRDRLDKPLFLENLLYLSPTRLVQGVFEDRLAGRTVFRPSLVNNQLQEIPPLEADKNRVKVEMNLTLDEENHLSGGLALEVGGSLNPYMRLVDGYESWASGRLKGLLPGATMKDVKPLRMDENRSMFSASTDKPAKLEKEKDYDLFIYEIPDCPGGAADMHIPVATTERTRPLWLPRPVHEELNLTIGLPDGMEAVYLPPQQSLSNSVGKILSAVWVEEGVLHLTRTLVLNKQLIPKGEYPALRKLITEWSAGDARRVVLKEKATGGKDSEPGDNT
ncbi:MAG: DUF3857 domain-containing protein [Planctomycetota bacterium]|jgi:hypothetical protein